MKMADIRQMASDELHGELEHMRRHLFDLRSLAVTEKLENPHQLTAVRRDIARLLTALGERGEVGIEEKQHHLEAVSAHQRGA